jgi:hypothetical protein
MPKVLPYTPSGAALEKKDPLRLRHYSLIATADVFFVPSATPRGMAYRSYTQRES